MLLVVFLHYFETKHVKKANFRLQTLLKENLKCNARRNHVKCNEHFKLLATACSVSPLSRVR